MSNLQQSINWAQTFIQYSPITAGLGQEPAVSAASMIRNTLLNPPQTWYWNRASYTLGAQTVKGTQDYLVNISAIPDFGFLEVVTLTDANGKVWQLTDVYNRGPLSAAADQQRPTSVSVLSQSATQITLRFMGVPNAVYTVTLIYQKKAQSFGPFAITSAANHSSGNTAYTGTFDPLSFPAGSVAQITGFVTNPGNNGSFVVVSCTATTLTVVNGAGVAETVSAYTSNFDWAPIPDYFVDVYNNLFLSEMFMAVDDPQRAQVYRQRGIAAFLSKAEGLTETQKNAFIQQVLARSVEAGTAMQMMQQGNQGRAV